MLSNSEEENIYAEFWLEILSESRILKQEDGDVRITLKYILRY
jgi:hypothetical protein